MLHHTTQDHINIFVIGAPLIIHPGRADPAPFEIVDILQHAGADLSRTVMSHIDRTILSKESVLKFAQLGCGIEYDLFGIECSHYQVLYILVFSIVIIASFFSLVPILICLAMLNAYKW